MSQPPPPPKTPPQLQNPHVAAMQGTTSLAHHGATPRKAPLAIHPAFRPDGNLEARRDAVTKYVGEVPIVPVEFVYESFLNWSITNTHPMLLDAVERELIARKHLKNGIWRRYSVSPSRMEGKEDKVFLPLGAIIKAIVSATNKVLDNGTTRSQTLR
ncbi:hypothetical protein B0H15DRAFT_831739 [Mycena belliarum]|uniref:Uncharacterized protein n=1 Tax=Mycena belliarum TaxID=1033014 RepID=A0AAD6UAK6_9AGAR|nr:hypothetical protein B0H15DRAFT_831739 [Mycena belliae]